MNDTRPGDRGENRAIYPAGTLLAQGHGNSSLASATSLAGAVAVLWLLNSTALGPTARKFIPFADLWICLGALIVFCGLSSVLIRLRRPTLQPLSVALLLTLAAVLIVTILRAGGLDFYLADTTHGGPARRLMYTSAWTWAASLATCALLTSSLWTRDAPARWILWLGWIAAAAFSAGCAQYMLLVQASPYAGNEINLGVVLMPIVNLFHGAFPPLDAQSQYGYYAYFMVPLLKLTGLSLFSQSALFSGLFALCLLSIYAFTLHACRRVAPALAATVAAVFINTSFGNVWPAELYLQYRPIRMLAPCAALILFVWMGNTATHSRRLCALSLLGLLVLWNSDSGIPALAAFVVVMAADAFFDRTNAPARRLARSLARCAEGVAVLAAILALFALLLFAARGKWVTAALFFEPLVIWRKSEGFFTQWSQPILLPALAYATAVALAISRGSGGHWQRLERALLLTGLLGLGVATYGTQNPQAAALAAYLLPVALALLAACVTPSQGSGPAARLGAVAISALLLLPCSFLAVAYFFHIPANAGYSAMPRITEILWPSPSNTKDLWMVPGPGTDVVGHIKLGQLAAKTPPVPPWEEKAQWLASLDYLRKSAAGDGVFIASVHDHYLYAALSQATPVRLVNFVHIPIFHYWPVLSEAVRTRRLEYVVVDYSYLLRNTDSKGPASFDALMALLQENYSAVEARDIGYDWHYPGWKPTTVTVYKRKAP